VALGEEGRGGARWSEVGQVLGAGPPDRRCRLAERERNSWREFMGGMKPPGKAGAEAAGVKLERGAAWNRLNARAFLQRGSCQAALGQLTSLEVLHGKFHATSKSNELPYPRFRETQLKDVHRYVSVRRQWTELYAFA